MAPIGAMMYAAFILAAAYSTWMSIKNRKERKPITDDDDY